MVCGTLFAPLHVMLFNNKSFSVACFAVVGLGMASADTIDFYSGTGGAAITTLAGPSSSAFGPLTSANFASADAGPSAYSLGSSLAGGWLSGLSFISPLPDDAVAGWVSVDSTGGNNSYASHTALYDMAFNLASSTSDATLNLHLTCDDQLGDGVNQGVYVDGNGLAGSSTGVLWDGQEQALGFLHLGALSAGEHHLYFNVLNSGGGPSGIMFSGELQTVPEPASIGFMALGALGVIVRRRRN